MDDFQKELLRRSPLATSVLELSDFMLEPALLSDIFQEHRGRCYEDVLKFPDFVGLVRDALMQHQGSGHQLFLELESENRHPIDESNFYRKLSHMPPELSEALLRRGGQRLSSLMPDVVATPACLKEFTVVVADGKKIKNAAKRLKLARKLSGKLIGATALVGINARTGLAVAMSSDLDGMTNDVPLVPRLMEQLHQEISGPICSIWDRQFDNHRTLQSLCARQGDTFVVRMNQGHRLEVEQSTQSLDSSRRVMEDQVVVMGRGKQAMRLRRIVLNRPGQEPIIILTNLMDAAKYPPEQLLELYKMRWGIEQIFQQITQTFSLEHLIGSHPKAVLFQFSLCLLVYNLMQVVRAYVAEDGKVLTSAVSMYYLFGRTRQELCFWARHCQGCWDRMPPTDAPAMAARLRQLLKGSWDPIGLKKAADKKPRGEPSPRQRLHGGYNSMQRALEGRARLAEVK